MDFILVDQDRKKPNLVPRKAPDCYIVPAHGRDKGGWGCGNSVG